MGATLELIKDWRLLARLVKKLTHRGIIHYGVYLIGIILGLIMCVTSVADITIKSILEENYANPLVIWNNISPMDIENDVVHGFRSFSLNNLINGSHTQDLIPSSWGRSSATCSTHSEYHSREMKLSSTGDPMKVEAVVRRFDGESRPAGHNRFISPMRHTLTQDAWGHDTCDNSFSVNTLIIDNSMQPQTIIMPSLPTNYSHPATGPDTTFDSSLPSHVGAHHQTKLIASALWDTNTSKTHPDMCRMDEQTLSLSLMPVVPNYYDDF